MRFLYLIALVVLASCSKEDKKVEYVYENCCGIPALVEQVGNGNLYVPNVFSPNYDGLNDFFMVITNENIETVNTFIIKNQAGVILFQRDKYDPEYIQGDNSNAWDGKGLDGEVLAGVFKYEVSVTSQDGMTQIFHGDICSWLCTFGNTKEELKAPTNFFPNCAWASQHDGNGMFDPQAPSGETIVGECVAFD